MRVNLARSPLRLDRGIIDNVRDLVEDDLDFERWAGSVCSGTASIVSCEDWE